MKSFLKKLRQLNQPRESEKGSILVFEIVVIFIFSVMMLAVLGTAVQQFRVTRSAVYREQAFAIAEAGTNYYQWHLAKFPNDFQNGTGVAPTMQSDFGVSCYPQDYIDQDTTQVIGKYCLQITAPLTGSTIVTIKSYAYTTANPKIIRNITTRYGVPSLAKYGFLTNSDAWIGSSESVSGLMHSNGGIRFDGTGNAPITSAKSTYTCTPTFGCSPSAIKSGVWGAAVQSTKNFWDYPVPNVDFSSITSNFATIKTAAQTSGIYLPPSNAQGYSLVFSVVSGVGKVSVYKVTSLRSHASGTDVNGVTHNEDLDYSGRTLQFTQDIPANGQIYIEDKTWVEGTLKGRALVAAAKLPYNASSAPDIIIPNNILYHAKDGTSVLGLIAQKNVLVSYYAPSTLEINAAMFAQNGSCQFFYFSGNVKNTITVYGTVGSYGIWTWSWVNGGGTVVSGFQNTITTYDANLLYGPPPSFPLTTEGYQQISWVSN